MTPRVPPVLPPASYLRFIRMQTGGERADTHLALVRNAAGTPMRAYVKQFHSTALRGLFNEWFGYAVMSALGVPQPNAALLFAPVPNRRRFVWSFASFAPVPRNEGTPKEIYDCADLQQLAVLAERLLSCHHFALLVAADQICMNGDRNLGNLVFTGPHDFVAIDHSDVLGGVAWTKRDLDQPVEWMQSKLLDACELQSRLPPEMQSALLAAAQVASAELRAEWRNLHAALASEQDARSALALVTMRGRHVADWFRNRLNLLT